MNTLAPSRYYILYALYLVYFTHELYILGDMIYVCFFSRKPPHSLHDGSQPGGAAPLQHDPRHGGAKDSRVRHVTVVL